MGIGGGSSSNHRLREAVAVAVPVAVSRPLGEYWQIILWGFSGRGLSRVVGGKPGEDLPQMARNMQFFFASKWSGLGGVFFSCFLAHILSWRLPKAFNHLRLFLKKFYFCFWWLGGEGEGLQNRRFEVSKGQMS